MREEKAHETNLKDDFFNSPFESFCDQLGL
jgi:hypothetical protein